MVEGRRNELPQMPTLCTTGVFAGFPSSRVELFCLKLTVRFGGNIAEVFGFLLQEKIKGKHMSGNQGVKGSKKKLANKNCD